MNNPRNEPEEGYVAETPSAPDMLRANSLQGLCLLLAHTPARSVMDGWVLPEGEVVHIPPGKQFTVFSSLSGKPRSEVFHAIDHTWLKGPVLWSDQFTDLDVEKHILPDLAEAADHKVRSGDVYLAIGGAAGLSFTLIAYLLHSLGASPVVLLLFALIVTGACAFLGVLTALGLEAENISGFRRAAKMIENPVVRKKSFSPFAA